jgi:predicted metal-dependent phosphoesterase TrpH
VRENSERLKAAPPHDPATADPAPRTFPPVEPPPGGWSEVDLHVHTTASDGRLTPGETVALALARGVKVLALTDHDSTEGIDAARAAAEGSGLEIITGVEINTDTPQGEAHVLGYLFDHRDPALQARLADRRRARFERGAGIVRKLNALGFDISWERVQEIAGADDGGSVGRPHVALALQERGYVATTKEAFEKYIGSDGPAYVPYEKLTPVEAVQIIRRAGGLPVLAHPSNVQGLVTYLAPLMEAGLAGIECYYGAYTPETVIALVAIAEQLGLVATGGSDYHGSEQTTYNATLGGAHMPMSVVTALKQRHAALRSG